MVKNLPAMQETQVRSLDWEDPLEKGMAIHSNIVPWRIPWTKEPGRLQSLGSHDWATNTHFHSWFMMFCQFQVYSKWFSYIYFRLFSIIGYCKILNIDPCYTINACEMKVAQSCLTLCDPMDYTSHGILQARILEWVAFLFSRGSCQPRKRTGVSCIADGFFINWAISLCILCIVIC